MTERVFNLQPEVIHLYVDEKISTKEISIKIGINIKTVLKILKQNKIQIRGSKKNLIEKTFGRLTVIRYSKLDSSQKAMWECLCICNNRTIVRGSDLISGKVKSCGCLLSETSKENVKISHQKYPKSTNFKGIGDLPGRYLSIIRNRSMGKGYEYDVNKEYLWKLFQSQNGKCALTGLEIHFSVKGSDQTASLDRIDSSKGYIKGNVQWVHKDVNNIKQDYTMTELVDYCKMILLKCGKEYESNKSNRERN